MTPDHDYQTKALSFETTVPNTINATGNNIIIKNSAIIISKIVLPTCRQVLYINSSLQQFRI
ncbi:hypothetical protein Plhal304r1_c035g0108701 [Plasmopara halstedii]